MGAGLFSAASLVALVLGGSPVVQAATAPRTAQAWDSPANGSRGVVYVVVPHPDDEFEAWSLIQHSDHTVKVFVLLTHGERTAACSQPRNDRPGEVPPANSEARSGTAACGENRLVSWTAVLDSEGQTDPAFDRTGPFQELVSTVPAGNCNIADHRFRAATGDLTARLVFNLGDGKLKPCTVAWAVRSARAFVQKSWPGSPEQGVVGAAYYNVDRSCLVIDNPDHAAVYHGVLETDLGVPYRLTATCGHTFGGSTRQATVASDIWSANMAVGRPRSGNPSSGYEAVGLLQRQYGWLFAANLDFDDQTGRDFAGGPGTEYQFRQTFATAGQPPPWGPLAVSGK